MKFAACNEMYQGWAFDRVCADLAGCGYDAVEIAPFTLDEDPRRVTEAQALEIARTAAGHGLKVSALHWLLAKPLGLHVSTPDPAVRRATLAFLQHLARLGHAMGAGVLVFGSPKQRNLVEGDRYEDAFARATELFRQLCDTLAPLGMTLALEPLGPADTSLLRTADETVGMIRAVNHPACRLHLDVKAMVTEPKPIPQIIAEHADDLAYFHANDSNLRGPGFGTVDFVPIAAALARAGYDGYVSVEVFDYTPDPQTIARQSLEYLRKTFAT